MDQQGVNPQDREQQSGNFEATDWQTVLAAREQGSEASASALERLCSTYHYPLYVYVRRKAIPASDVEDYIQGFFEHLLSSDGLKTVSQSKGKFRSFLVASLENFIAKERQRNQAQKRGGGKQILSLEAMEAEERYRHEPRDEWTPEKALNRSWALVLIETVMERLRAEQSEGVRLDRFNELVPYLHSTAEEGDYALVASKLGTSEGNIRVLVGRLRARFATLLRSEVGRTVSDPSEIETEIQELLGVLTHWRSTSGPR